MRNEQGESVFTIPKEDQEKFDAFVAEHNTECSLPPGYHGFIDSSKYVYRFRGTSVGRVIQLACDCGKELEIHPLDNENL